MKETKEGREAAAAGVRTRQRYNKRGESTAGDREGKWDVTEAVGNAKVRTLCVGECSLGCLPGSRWAS